MVFELVVGLDRHVEKARELLVRRRAASFGDRVLDAVGCSRELGSEAGVARSRESARDGSARRARRGIGRARE